MNEMLEYLFYDFLTNPAGDQMAELDKLQDGITAQLEAEGLDAQAVAAFKVEALQAGFAAGYAAAQKVQAAKYMLAARNRGQRAG